MWAFRLKIKLVLKGFLEFLMHKSERRDFTGFNTPNYSEQRMCEISVYGETCRDALVQRGFCNPRYGAAPHEILHVFLYRGWDDGDCEIKH